MKEGNIIKPILKHEAEYLRNNGFSEYVIGGHGTYHNLLVVENNKVLKFLNEYHEENKRKAQNKK